MIQDVLDGRTDHLVLEGDSQSVLATLPADLFHCCITSPPYYALRDYGTGTWEGGDAGCDHIERTAESLSRSSTLGPKRDGLGPDNAAHKGKETRYKDVCGKCGARRIDQQIGLEQTVEEYLARLVAVFREVKRVLRPDGLLAVNMGESYANEGLKDPSKVGGFTGARIRAGVKGTMDSRPREIPEGLKAGDCMAIPARLCLALQADGWLYRGAIVWHKKSPMPASLNGWRWERCRVKVKNRPNNRHAKIAGNCPDGEAIHFDHRTPEGSEWSLCPGCPRCEPTGGLVLRRGSWRPTPSWEPVYLFARAMSYFADGEAVRQPAVRPGDVQTFGKRSKVAGTFAPGDPEFRNGAEQWGRTVESGTNGANLRDVWDLPDDGEVWRWLAEVGSDALRAELARLMPAYLTGDMTDVLELGPEPLSESHYAAFPTSLPTRILRFATSERGVCPWCGAPHARIVEREFQPLQDRSPAKLAKGSGPKGFDQSEHGWSELPRGNTNTTTLGWRQTCNCTPTDPVSSIVLDPFSGAASTGVACRRLGLRYVGVELSPEYVKLSRKRLAGCLRQSKRLKVKDGHPLFDGLEES